MTKRTWRLVSLMLACALLLLSWPTFAEPSKDNPQADIPSWFWFMGYDRSPNAVRNRFNTLAAEWSQLADRKAWPKPPSFGATVSTAQHNEFMFCYSERDTMPLFAQNMMFDIVGIMDSSGKVESLSVSIAPQGDFGRDYLRAGDQLMQLTLFSLFDVLNERTNRNLTLQYIYDVRPFSFRNDKTDLKDVQRTTHAVVDGQLIELASSASAAGSALHFQVRLAGPATESQKQAAATNDSCNRLLSQTATECADLKDCAQQLSDLGAQHAPDWDVMRAISGQLSESISVIDELCFKLYEYPKALTYASRMHEHCDELLAAKESLAGLIDDKSISEIQVQLTSILTRVTAMQSLTTLLHR